MLYYFDFLHFTALILSLKFVTVIWVTLPIYRQFDSRFSNVKNHKRRFAFFSNVNE